MSLYIGIGDLPSGPSGASATQAYQRFAKIPRTVGYRPVRPQWAIYAVLAWLRLPDRRVEKSKMGDGEGGSGGREPGLDPLHGRNANPGFAGDLADTLPASL